MYTITNRTLGKKEDGPAGDQSTNWAELRRQLAEAARKVDQTCAQLGIESTLEQQVNVLMDQATNPVATARSWTNHLLSIHNTATLKFQEEERWRKLVREAQAEAAVPMSQRFTPAKIY